MEQYRKPTPIEKITNHANEDLKDTRPGIHSIFDLKGKGGITGDTPRKMSFLGSSTKAATKTEYLPMRQSLEANVSEGRSESILDKVTPTMPAGCRRRRRMSLPPGIGRHTISPRVPVRSDAEIENNVEAELQERILRRKMLEQSTETMQHLSLMQGRSAATNTLKQLFADMNSKRPTSELLQMSKAKHQSLNDN